ncbi:hypothetical protein [Micromonospora sp. NPDC092111]|uniref:hypothetical protein n=1 Tax=Micromonospora sp. NPDC092111 TaxID=3364289 RepID=UPI0038157552
MFAAEEPTDPQHRVQVSRRCGVDVRHGDALVGVALDRDQRFEQTHMPAGHGRHWLVAHLPDGGDGRATTSHGRHDSHAGAEVSGQAHGREHVGWRFSHKRTGVQLHGVAVPAVEEELELHSASPVVSGQPESGALQPVGHLHVDKVQGVTRGAGRVEQADLQVR